MSDHTSPSPPGTTLLAIACGGVSAFAVVTQITDARTWLLVTVLIVANFAVGLLIGRAGGLAELE
jgi:hypothetical protein